MTWQRGRAWQLLVSSGSPLPPPPLHRHPGDERQVARLLAKGCSPNCADYDRRTGLMLAAANGHQVCRPCLHASRDTQLH